MTARPYITSASDSVRAARAIQKMKDRRDQWPYWWLNAPPDSTGKRIFDSIPVPAPATPTAVVTYQVPNAMKFILTGIVFDYSGGPNSGGWIQGGPQAAWSLTVNQPTGTAAPQGFQVDGFNQLPLLLGSLQEGPYPLGKPEIFKAQDIVRIIFTNVTLGVGDPNYALGSLVGWIMPE